jgi:hypothetical protein
MLVQGDPQNLHAERVQLEREIAQLRNRLAVAERSVIRAQGRGPDPRGFVAGVLVGAAVVVGTVAALFLWVASVVGRID